MLKCKQAKNFTAKQSISLKHVLNSFSKYDSSAKLSFSSEQKNKIFILRLIKETVNFSNYLVEFWEISSKMSSSVPGIIQPLAVAQ